MELGAAAGLIGTLIVVGTLVFRAGIWHANTKNDQRTVERLEETVSAQSVKMDDLGRKMDDVIHRVSHVERQVAAR